MAQISNSGEQTIFIPYVCVKGKDKLRFYAVLFAVQINCLNVYGFKGLGKTEEVSLLLFLRGAILDHHYSTIITNLTLFMNDYISFIDS